MAGDLKSAAVSRNVERQRLYDVLETLPVYVVLLDKDYRVPFANKFFRERFGESHGKRCYEYLFNRTAECENCETYKVMKTGAPHHWEWTGPDNRNYDIHDFPFKDTDGSGMILEMGIDVTEQKKAQEALNAMNETLEKQVEERTLQLRESEKQVRMKLEGILSPEGDIGDFELGDILDSRLLQAVMDTLYKLTHIPLAIIDIKGKVLVGIGWQDICTKFHRVNPETCAYCVESDTHLSADIPHGEFRVYKCKNGLWDAATPIMIGDKHIGNIFTGQFFFEGEQPDHEFFKAQAKRYGFNERDYLAALERVPQFSKETVNNAMVYFMHFSHALSQLSYSNIKLARLLAERDALTESLRESEKQMNTAQEIASLGSWDLDLVKNRLSWSDEVYRIFGLKPQEFGATYEAFLKAVHPDDRAAVDAAYSDSVREGRDSYEIEHRIVRRPTGEIRFVHEKCEHTRDASGKIIRSVGMVHDITERKIAEAELSRAKEEWERTFDSVPDMIAILDDKHRIVRANKAMAKALATSPEKCTGLSCFEHVHGTSCPPDFCPHAQTLKDGKEHIAEIHEERLGGDFLVSTTPIFDEEGRMKGAVHVARDITARKKSEEDLRRITRVFKALSDNGYAMMNANDEPEYLEEACKIIVNDCGHLLAWIGFAENDKAKTVRPAAQAGFEDGYLEKLDITWADSERGRGPTGRAIRTGNPAICRNILTDPDFGPWREEAIKRGYAASIVLPLVSDNRVFGAVNIYSKDPDPFSEDEIRLLTKLADDIAYGVAAVRLRITNKKAEEILKRDKDTLERLVREKSKELLDAHMELDMAKRLSDIGTLAATVAHELRNPLAAMNMAAANIKRKANNPALDKHIFTIEKKVTESNQIINNLLFYSRIKPPAYENVDIHGIIEECVDSAEEKTKRRATFENAIDCVKGILIMADATQIKEVINNILNNAIDALPEERGRVRVKAENEGDTVAIGITDNGAGIAKDHLDRIFDPFFTTKARGTGLGLSVCRQIIDFHGGSIGIESEPGKGTTVMVRLPNKGKQHG